MEVAVLEKSNLLKRSKIEYILVSCCTYKRPKMLALALIHLRRLNLPKNIKVEVLIVDNAPDYPAIDVVNNFSKNFPTKIHYVQEHNRGLSFARNRLLREAESLGATHIALFDDDGLVDENWLIEHIEAYQATDAHIISGPQYTWFSKNYPRYITHNNIFKSSSSKKFGTTLNACATNNVFLPVDVYSTNGLYFDEIYVSMGGEDGDFFNKLSKLGYKIIFNPKAIVKEITDETRASIFWVISRSYYNGYSGALLKFKYNNKWQNKIFYILKTFFIILLDCIWVLLSMFFGATCLLNAFCLLAKNLGKLMGVLKGTMINYYAKQV